MHQWHRASAVAAVAAALLVSLTPACSKSSEGDGKSPAPSGSAAAKYTTKGKVRAIGERKDNITIAHEDIPGYMKAMTMMFEVERPETIGDVKVGDDVTFTFSDRDGRLFVESLSKK
jgi:protein SCO1/2